MEKTIKVGKQEFRLNNNFGWAMTYRDQFGHDIIPTLAPMLAAAIDVASGIIRDAAVNGEIKSPADVLKVLDGDTIIDAVIHLSSFELVEIANIAWAMAKECDSDIPDPKAWVAQYDPFPLDVLAPEVFSLAFNGMVSSKNLKRLKGQIKQIKQTVQPLTSTPLSSRESNED